MISIAPFKHDRSAALSFTFDDNTPDHVTLAAPMLEKYGFRGTFALIADRVPDEGNNGWPQWQRLLENGHEIANHSATHPHLTEIDDAALEREVNGAAEVFRNKLGFVPFTFIYPYSSRDERVWRVVQQQHFAAREGGKSYGRPEFVAATANAWLDEAIRERTWLVPIIHNIEGGKWGFSHRSVLDEHLQYVKQHVDEVWADTFVNVSRYVQQREAAKLTCETREDGVSFSLTCDLNPDVFNVPLTVVVPLSTAKEATVVATHAGKPLPFVRRGDDLLIEVAPSEHKVDISWTR